ncbi:dihydropteroate synthase [Niveibacterium sp. 24ML]|uniref:dihydropteroate synthase n=1 Tax=Niveibacterium sp. 24ML TaxID=2985512 RepID=UPI0022707DE9|nr:dihydropteroate synthase [Niveibacterium sp. 24ML]MCX9155177.1 dihydropteroate synthase [Niveibacterium sp. 24ML]
MAIINTTPDSFSGDGVADSVEVALAKARKAIDDGADILDVGGESSRPGAASISVDEELRRVLPCIRALAALGKPVSVDTAKPEVMAQALAAGAAIVNDINALRAPGAIEVVADSDCAVCLMHMQGEPRIMQNSPAYSNVVREVAEYLAQRKRVALAAGITEDRILLDPGFGFGKTTEQNCELFCGLQGLGRLGPLLVGVSRKSMLGALTGLPVEQRVIPSVVAAAAAVARGASVLRVHDVAETIAALAVWRALGAELGA